MSVLKLIYACAIKASIANAIPVDVVMSVIEVEGGRPGLSVVNSNATQDLGVMQINTGAWLNFISDAVFNGNRKLAYDKLKNDVCFNINVGTWILAESIRLEKGDIWEGVGRYHSQTNKHKKKYIAKVKKKYTERMVKKNTHF